MPASDFADLTRLRPQRTLLHSHPKKPEADSTLCLTPVECNTSAVKTEPSPSEQAVPRGKRILD